ncbi:L-seryl-tRNA(Sec) selenium transferase [Kamptonema cortianum]|nr:L-seryl-tRNA(Sec) selenium transferase [Kamptonema cortianum]
MTQSERSSRPPSVDALAREIGTDVAGVYAVEGARRAIAKWRQSNGKSWTKEDVEIARRTARELAGSSVKPLINLSGVALHTGLGRARVAKEVADHMQQVAGGHASVEIELDSGERGNRQDHVRWLLQELTGAEDSLVVNNCAGAVILALSALAQGRDVVLSRGQMVEIGGAFRMPDIIRMSGCHLVEVGCTNRTHLQDYESAMGENPGALLKCHQSNFAQVGFVQDVSAKDMANLAESRGWMLIDDLGSGCLVDTTDYGLPKERTLREAVSDGASIVTASGDKLLGGPQAGILLGKKDLIRACSKHPLARALRIDKVGIAGLEATLRLYLENRHEEIPLWHDLSQSLAEVKKRATALKSAANRAGFQAVMEEGITEIGGGSLPGKGVPTWRVGIPETVGLAASFRSASVIIRTEKGMVWMDPRTATASELKATHTILSQLGETR